MSVGNSDEPAAILGVWIFIWVLRWVDGPIFSCDIIATRSCKKQNYNLIFIFSKMLKNVINSLEQEATEVTGW